MADLNSLWFDVAIVMSVFAFGTILFGHFEEHKPKWRRILKVVIVSTIVVTVSATFGRPWAFGLLALPLVAALGIHVWWLPKHGINGWTGEPKEKYHELIGHKDYEALLSAAEDAADRAAIDARRDEPVLPHNDAMALIRGELHPVAAWRKARGLTQAELGSRAGVRGATISDIEASKSAGRFDVMQRIAEALSVDLDDLALPVGVELSRDETPGI